MASTGGTVRKYTLIFIVFALVLTACRIESNVGLDIREDGSATVTIEIGFDDEFLELMGSQGGFTTDDFLGEIMSESDGTVIERRDGDMNYYGVTTEVEDLSTWDADTDATEFTDFSYSYDDEGAQLTATITAEETGDFGGDFGFDPSAITGEFISASLTVRMPGTVTAHNADQVRDGALVWDIGLTGSTDVTATSAFGGSDFPWLVILLIVALIAALVGAIVALIVSRKNNERQLAAIQAAKATTVGTEGESPQPPSPVTDAPASEDEAADEDSDAGGDE